MGIYLFIDGGYLREDYARAVEPWFDGKGEINFAAIVNRSTATRSFYYDAAEDEDPSVFARIQEEAGCVLRLGSLKGRKKRQKKVDIMLALDMVNHAVRKNMFRAILVAGDHDFEPVVRAVSDLGIPVEVVADSRSRALELTNAADKFTPITFLDYWNWSAQNLKDQFPIPQIGGLTVAELEPVVKRGSVAGRFPCKLFNPTAHRPPVDTYWCLSIQSYKNAESIMLGVGAGTTAPRVSTERLQLFCDLQYGKVEWE